ncbi:MULTISPECIES: hypothetical protein [unclassified Streptomyces]|uniref:hypothetical protein n=1 Tax=unclassified Streptomyces TaxID=2593676 RepID=UPI00386F1A52|nr:hypothetical protein OG569_20345 [Streptomyces sp. NBC_00827]
MTAVTTARPLAERRSPLIPRGAVWAALRLHRTPLRIWWALVAVTAAGLLWAYVLGADAVREWNRSVASCATATGCVDTLDGTYEFYDLVTGLATSAIAYLPYLVAAWAGATLVARDLESGTSALAWTQSVTPARWLAAQLAVPAALITAGTTVLVVLHRLMWTDGRDILGEDWYSADVFRANGPVALGYALCALAVGALAGLLVRRTLPALGLALAVTVAVHTLGDLYRASLWPPVTVTGAAASNLPADAAPLEHGVILTSGERIGNNLACVDNDTAADLTRCMSKNGISDLWATYHPPSHFWPLQLTESAILLTLTALVVFLTFRVLKRRTA